MKHVPIALFGAAALLSVTADAQQVKLEGRTFLEAARQLKPGQYLWEPQRSPQGPVLAIANLHTQRLVLFRDGVPIGASTISSGSKGHETPTGVFTILQKRQEHYSSTYNNAPMPNMQRLTWGGVALHAGKLPGYPASHGCVRLPHKFSELLFGATELGMTVVITHHPEPPHGSVPPDVVEDSAIDRSAIQNAQFEWNPGRAPAGEETVEVIVSKADHRAIVMKGPVKIGSAPVYVHGPVHGTEAYLLETWDSKGPHWIKIHFSETGKGMQAGAHEAEHFDAPAKFRHDLHTVLRPGSIVVVTPLPLSAGGPGTKETVIADMASAT
jgi:hypothetical protein